MTEQFVFGRDEQGNYVEFQERQVKTNQGGIKQRNLKPRDVRHYEIPGDRSFYAIISKYKSLTPPVGKFYRHVTCHVLKNVKT